jgi:hypothetical protein
VVETEPAPQEETGLRQAAFVSAKAARISALASIVAIVVGGVVAVVSAETANNGLIRSADIAASSVHAETLGEKRRDAYSAYLGDLADLNELVSDNLYLAGTGGSPPPRDVTDKFWGTAEPLQARLAADVGRAKMLTGDAAVRTDLDLVDKARGTMYYEFKCESGLQWCAKPRPTTRAQTEGHFQANSKQVETLTTHLIDHAAHLVGS